MRDEDKLKPRQHPASTGIVVVGLCVLAKWVHSPSTSILSIRNNVLGMKACTSCGDLTECFALSIRVVSKQ